MPSEYIDRRIKERRKPAPLPALTSIAWPAIVGVCLGAMAPELLRISANLGNWAARLAFPLALLASRPEFGFGESLAKIFSTLALYLQFPIEGTLAMYGLRRKMKLWPMLGCLAALHGMAAAVLWLLDRPHRW